MYIKVATLQAIFLIPEILLHWNLHIYSLQFQSELEKAADLHQLSRMANAPNLDFKVPWSVFTFTTINQNSQKGFLGSGSLITGKAVLTAGHNICTDVNPPKNVSRQGL